MNRKTIEFLTGAGISAESGLKTFRDEGGLWTHEEWYELADVSALQARTQDCLDFYNMRRKQLLTVFPNHAHKVIAELEQDYNVMVVTQNVDDLHERAGSSTVIHLHGELRKVCSMADRTTCIMDYPLDIAIKIGDKAADGAQLRPYIVMFGEGLDTLAVAIDAIKRADVLVVIGTSLTVYPAAGLLHYAKKDIPRFVINPGNMEECVSLGFRHIVDVATRGMDTFMDELLKTEMI